MAPVFSLPPSFDNMEILDFPTREPAPFAPVEGLDTRDVTESLRRLYGYGLIDGTTGGYMGGEHWHDLRLTHLGLIYLGEWPDLELAASAASIHNVLRMAAEEAPEEERKAMLRAAGVVGRTVDDVVRGTLSEVAHSAGGDASD